jgi:hypothetical protein
MPRPLYFWVATPGAHWTGLVGPCVDTFFHSVVCLTTGPQPLQKRVLHRVRSSTSCLNFQDFLVYLRLSSSCLRLLPYVLSLLGNQVRFLGLPALSQVAIYITNPILCKALPRVSALPASILCTRFHRLWCRMLLLGGIESTPTRQ